MLEANWKDAFLGVDDVEKRVPCPRIPRIYPAGALYPMYSGLAEYVHDGLSEPVSETKAGELIFERAHKSRWLIRGVIKEEGGRRWLVQFVARHIINVDWGLVWGEYGKTTWSEDEEAFLDFVAHHPGKGWDGP